jgi:excisionase family DNA binding protein
MKKAKREHRVVGGAVTGDRTIENGGGGGGGSVQCFLIPPGYSLVRTPPRSATAAKLNGGLLTVAEAWERLGRCVSKAHVYNCFQKGVLKGTRIGGKILISAASVDALLRGERGGAAPGRNGAAPAHEDAPPAGGPGGRRGAIATRAGRRALSRWLDASAPPSSR